MNAGLAIVGLTLLLVAAVSRRLSSTPITPAMVVVAVGVLVGPLVLDGLAVPPTSSTVRTLAEATLAVVLFSDSSRVAGMTRFTEETGAALDGVTFLVFGAVLLGPALEHMSWQIALYAVLSLTIVRMLPAAISLWGTHARAPTVAFMGWFGPRGLASIVFAVIVEDAHLPHAATIAAASYLTVGLSVLAHGLSAAPLVSRYATWYQAAADKGPPAMESQSAQEPCRTMFGALDWGMSRAGRRQEGGQGDDR